MKTLIFAFLSALLLVAGAAYAENSEQVSPRWDNRLAGLCPEKGQSLQLAVIIPAWRCDPSNYAVPSFFWPVRGLVTSGFGAQNEGINVAVPEGTPIKAADDGVVAYAGNELKKYGNLVIVRHANGYVSAYGNASQLLVTRGDSIKRGQVIAHAGQTGNVTSPQLHFEIRKGSTPVDPLPFLGKAN